MSSTGSITHWLGLLKVGDQVAAQKLWESYFQKLVHLARKKLRDTPRRAADEEDVALGAFDSFCRGAERGRFPQLHDRDDLWQLLVVLTTRKALNLRRYEGRQKRAARSVLDEAALSGTLDGSAERALEQVPSPEPSPEFATQVAENCRYLLDCLADPGLQALALLRMEGHTNQETAAKLGLAQRAVERKLRLIRNIWAKEIER